MKHILSPFSGSPGWEKLLGNQWTNEFNCTRFITLVLQIPHLIGGSYGAIFPRNIKPWRDAQPGDILVWRGHKRLARNEPNHAGIFVSRGWFLHNGYNCFSQQIPKIVQFARLTNPDHPRITVHRGRNIF